MKIIHRAMGIVALVPLLMTAEAGAQIRREQFPDAEVWGRTRPSEPKNEPKIEPRQPKERELPSERGTRGGQQASPVPGPVPVPPAPQTQKPIPTPEQLALEQKKAIDAEIAWLSSQTFGSSAEVNAAGVKLAILSLRRSFVPEFARGRPLEMRQQDQVQRALKTVTELREGNKSDNIPLRNAEYYLHGLFAKVAKDKEHEHYAKHADLYNELKKTAVNLKRSGFPQLEQMLRSNKNQPMSPPGGTEWALAGLKDGEGFESTSEIPGYIPDLPELRELGPEVILIQPTPYVEDKIIQLRPIWPDNRIRLP